MRVCVLCLALAAYAAPALGAAGPFTGVSEPPPIDADRMPAAQLARIQDRMRAFAVGSPGRPSPAADVIIPYSFVPIAGNLWDDVYINNYVDLDPTSGVKDFMCGSWTYDGHRGHDIDLRGFPYMDAAVPVFAALDGTVADAHDGEFDRIVGGLGSIPADASPNYVSLFHGGTQYSLYLHLRKGSVAVKIGDTVKAGQQIGLAGSSGFSSAPHLHFESQIAGAVFEPNAGDCRAGASNWVSQPTVRKDLYLAEFVVSDAILDNYNSALFGWPRSGSFTQGSHRVTVWFEPRNLPAGATWQVMYYRPDGTHAFDSPTYSFDNPAYRDLAFYWIGYDVNLNVLGTWKVELYLNGALMATGPFTVAADMAHVVNRPPNPITVALDPVAPLHSDVVFCRVTSGLLLNDPDYDIVRYHYLWKVNGATVRDITHAGRADAVPHDTATAGQTLSCTVTPTDGRADGAPVTVQAVIPGSAAGDVDGNGMFDAADVAAALRIGLGGSAASPEAIQRSGASVGGRLTSQSAVILMRRLMGL